MFTKFRIKKMIKAYPLFADLKNRYDRKEELLAQENMLTKRYKAYMPDQVRQELLTMHKNINTSFLAYNEIFEKLKVEYGKEIVNKFIDLLMKS